MSAAHDRFRLQKIESTQKAPMAGMSVVGSSLLARSLADITHMQNKQYINRTRQREAAQRLFRNSIRQIFHESDHLMVHTEEHAFGDITVAKHPSLACRRLSFRGDNSVPSESPPPEVSPQPIVDGSLSPGTRIQQLHSLLRDGLDQSGADSSPDGDALRVRFTIDDPPGGDQQTVSPPSFVSDDPFDASPGRPSSAVPGKIGSFVDSSFEANSPSFGQKGAFLKKNRVVIHPEEEDGPIDYLTSGGLVAPAADVTDVGQNK